MSRVGRIMRHGLSALGVGWSVFWSSTAMAQGGAGAETTIHGGTLVMVAYVGLWVIFGGVLLLVLRRQQRLQSELDGLESRIDEVLGTGSDGD